MSRLTLLLALGATLCAPEMKSQDTKSRPAGNPPLQAERGRVLFMDAARRTSCGNCHGIGEFGTKAAPDLKRWAPLPTRAMGTAILATLTEYVKAVKTKQGVTFPAFIISQDEKTINLYNVTKIPLAPEKMERSAIESVGENSTPWRHPPAIERYTAEQLADIIAFVRWAATGDKKGVNPAELEDLR